MAIELFEVHSGSQIINSFMECAECGIEPLQLNWFRATLRLYDSFIQSSSPIFQKVFHAGIGLSSINPSCWTSHMSFAMKGSHHAHGFQQKHGQPSLWI
eukprot:1153916-Pelagomonas_calceolata.AAC.2